MIAKRLYLVGIVWLFLCCSIIQTKQVHAQDCVDLLVSYQAAPDSLVFLILDRETGEGLVFDQINSVNNDRPIVKTKGRLAADADNQFAYQIYALEGTQQLGSEQAFLHKSTYPNSTVNPRILTEEGLFELQYSCVKEELYTLDTIQATPTITFVALVTINENGESNPVRDSNGNPSTSLPRIGEGIVEGVSALDEDGLYFYFVSFSGTDFTLHGVRTDAQPGFSVPLLYDAVDMAYDPIEGGLIILTADYKLVRYDFTNFNEVGDIGGVTGAIQTSNGAFDPTTPNGGSYFFIAEVGNTYTLYEISVVDASVISTLEVTLPYFNLTTAVPCKSKADFIFDNTCIGEETAFTDVSIGANAWEWDFDDPDSGTNNTSTEQNPVHTFTSPGTYEVTLRISGCSLPKDTMMQVTISEAPTPELFETITNCDDIEVLDAGNVGIGATYFWIDGSSSQTLTVTRSSGDRYYWVDISIGSCTIRDSVFVTFLENDYGTLEFPTTQVLCQDPPITLDASEGINDDVTVAYLWSTGATSPSIEVAGDGTYSVTISNPDDPITCPTLEASTTITFTNPDDVNFSFGEDVYTCESSYTIDPGSADSYEWSTGVTSSTLNVTESGFYSLTITNGECEVSDDILVELIAYEVELGGDANGDLTLCATQDLPLLDATPQNLLGLISDVPTIDYRWEDGSTNATRQTDANTSNYSVTVTIGDCSQEDFINLNIVDDIAAAVDLGEDRTVCSGESVTLSAGVTGATYLWSTGEATESIMVSNNGTYSVTVFGGCDASDEVSLTFLNDVSLDLGRDWEVCPTTGQVITLQPDVSTLGPLGTSFTYLWSNGSTSPQLEVAQGGDYAVTVTDGFTCTYIGATSVTEQCNSLVQVPNAFSPNGDNLNDIFLPRVEFVENYVFRIFDRWGNQLYETSNPDEGWDGLNEFELLPVGIYVWVITYTNEEAEEELMKGNVTLIR